MKKGNIIYSVLFGLPSFIIYTVFIIIPIAFTIYYSMTRWNALSTPVFIWLDNYKKLLADPDYFIVIKNTGILIIISLITQIPMGLIFAYLIFRTRIGKKFFRTAFFIPVVIASTAIGVMFTLLLSSDFGPINLGLAKIGLESFQRAWLSDPKVVLFSVILPTVWQDIGFYIIIFLAALYSIPEEIFESAKLDGANSSYIFIRIIIPLLKDVIGITAILCITNSLKAFDIPYIMTWGGPGALSSFLGVYIYKIAFMGSDFGYGSTIGVTILLIALIFTIIFKKILFRKDFEY